jgi:ribosomal protein S18 acetylase RimI-like enzyme
MWKLLSRGVTPDGSGAITVRDATAADLDRCLDLERALSPSRSDAVERGFLLPGSSRKDYLEYLSAGVFLIALRRPTGGKTSSGEDIFAGYLTALPGTHPRISRIANESGLEMNAGVTLDFPRLYWIGKLGVLPAFQHRGIARAMYERLGARLPATPLATATMISPVENRASSIVHEKLGFVRVGTYTAERAEYGKIVCAIYARGAL